MAATTDGPSPDSSIAVNANMPEKSNHISQVDSICTTATCGEDIDKTRGNTDLPLSPFPSNSDESEKSEWRGTLWRAGPLSGILSFLITALSTIASLGILVGSNHAVVDTWPTPPSTYIAIFTAIGNLAMRYAAIQGVIVAWWFKALRGSTVRSLHYDWRAGTSFHGAIMAGKHMGWLGIASIFSCIVLVTDGPLLQRASTVATDTQQGPSVDLQLTMVPQIPTDYSGAWITVTSGGVDSRWNAAYNDTLPSPTGQISNHVFAGGNNIFTPLVPLWAEDKPIPSSVSGCPGKCTTKLIAPALAETSCKKYHPTVDYAAPWPVKNAFAPFDSKYAPPVSHQSFIIATALDTSGEYENINTITAYAPNTECVGNITYIICSLESAVGEYNVTVENDAITIHSAANPRIISIANNTGVNHTAMPDGTRSSTLAGVVNAGRLIWDSSVVTKKVNGTASVSTDGARAGLLFQRGTYNEHQCPAFRNPRPEYTAMLNKLMVYLGWAAARGVSNPRLDTLGSDMKINATTTGYVTGTRSVFHTDYGFFAAAAVVQFICICLVAPTYWGWWEIGRIVSFSPLEIAKAFEAPALEYNGSNSTGRQIARQRDDELRYGLVTAKDGRTKLAFARPDSVNRPEDGCLVDV